MASSIPSAVFASDAEPTIETVAVEQSLTRYVRVGDYRWYVTCAGDNERVCVLLHGTGSSSHSWKPLIGYLAKHFTVVAIDLPGHANTQCRTTPDVSLKGMAKAVTLLLGALELNTHTVVGHSAGAAIAFQMLVDKPSLFKKVVSINGALVPLGGIPGIIFPPTAKISASFPLLSHLFSTRLRDPRVIDKLLKNTGSTISKESVAHYHALCNQSSHVQGALQMMANWRLEPLFRQLSRIRTQVQLITAENDSMIPKKDAYRLNAILKNSTLNLLPDLGHLAHEEQPELVANIILKGDS